MPKSDLEWDTFWSRIWSALWHTLGIIGVIACIPLVGAWIFYEVTRPPAPYKPAYTSTTHYNYVSTTEQKSLQRAFNVLIANEKRPCAVKNKGDKFSNLRECSLFRLKLGMLKHDVIQTLDSSGYFHHKATLYERCKELKEQEKEKCFAPYGYTHSVSLQRDGFSITVDFSPRSAEYTYLVAKEISLSFDFSSHPYFNNESIRATFIKSIGAPDRSYSGVDEWGQLYPGTRIYTSTTDDNKYYITLQDENKKTETTSK